MGDKSIEEDKLTRPNRLDSRLPKICTAASSDPAEMRIRFGTRATGGEAGSLSTIGTSPPLSVATAAVASGVIVDLTVSCNSRGSRPVFGTLLAGIDLACLGSRFALPREPCSGAECVRSRVVAEVIGSG